MKLRYSPTSPYARKVVAFAKEAGVDARMEVVQTPTGLAGELVRENPLGKVPSLVTDDGMVIFDSPVILEYLDSLNAGPKLIPASGPARWKALTLAALGDGIVDVCVARRGEVLRTKDKSEDYLKKQKDVAASALDALERDVASLAQPITVGQIAVGCALGYMDLRFAEDNWRNGRPKLAAWFETFSKRPSMASTAPPPA